MWTTVESEFKNLTTLEANNNGPINNITTTQSQHTFLTPDNSSGKFFKSFLFAITFLYFFSLCFRYGINRVRRGGDG
jgi:hypothetical protein